MPNGIYHGLGTTTTVRTTTTGFRYHSGGWLFLEVCSLFPMGRMNIWSESSSSYKFITLGSSGSHRGRKNVEPPV